jgi:predicted nucleic acid-binding protein
MRVMLDTNVLISAIVFPNDRMDADDYPVLYSAIVEDVDLFVTGDNDFANVEIEKPESITPAEFLEKY